MSTSKERKAQARAERQERERQTALAEQRRKRLMQLGGALAVAAVVVVALVLVSQGGKDQPNAGDGGAVVGVADATALLKGVEQRGTSLGDPKAPLVLTEFADLQCPFCKDFALNVLPGVVERYVRTGKLRLELRTLTFIGDDSVRGARAAQAAAKRNRMWNFVELWYRNQGEEQTGYGDDAFVSRIATASGVKPAVALDAIKSSAFGEPLRQAQTQAQAAAISSTPSFLIGPLAGSGQPVESDGSAASFFTAIDGKLKQ